ncbi:MAG: hypothetical protein B7Z73_19550 [Planctomycetia bacterium 21-64-5]|nr:MAG: hypothetical protein B7Z73_19550 [Planctomycetia bacterium 21-64-5]
MASKVAKTGSAITYYVANGVLNSIAASTDMPALVGTVANAAFNVFCFYADSAGNVTAQIGTAGATLKLTWYEGDGQQPPRELLGVSDSFKLPGAGSVLKGEQGTLVIPHVAMPQLLPAERFADYKFPEVGERNHYLSWADACRGEGTTTSHFDYAGPLTEAVLLGTVAIRVPHETLQWDAAALKITNSSDANALLSKPYREGWA